MRVYLDLAVILNLLVDGLLLLGTNRLAGFSGGFLRSAVAAAVGAIYAAACLIPGFSFLGSTLWRLVSLILMSGIAFGWNKSALQRGAVFVLLSIAMGGMSACFSRGGFGIVAVSACCIWLLCRFGFRGVQKEYVPVELCWNGKCVKLFALRDTGNTLRDPLTGEQVLVAGADVGMELLGLTQNQLRHPVELLTCSRIPGMRLIPYHAVGQSGSLLPAMRFPGSKINGVKETPLVAFAPEELARGAVYRMLTGGAV